MQIDIVAARATIRVLVANTAWVEGMRNEFKLKMKKEKHGESPSIIYK